MLTQWIDPQTARGVFVGWTLDLLVKFTRL